ncbi:MAG: hypothetical protein WCC01_03220 [Acidimicrobiia bacterium]
MRRLPPVLLRVWAGYREGALIRARVALSFVVVLLLVAGCSTDAGEEAAATTSTAAESTTTVTEAATTPVAAGEAQIDITYADSGPTYVGDREIREGTATVTFANETGAEAIVILMRYETGSTALAEELELVEEGGVLVTPDPPAAGYDEIDLEGSGALMPGSYNWTVDLEPGTYLFDVGPLDFHTTGLWRAVVFEVVSQ